MQPVVNYIHEPRKLLSSLVVKFNWLFPDAVYLKLRYYLYFGKRLDLKSPQTFSEKLQWLKLYNRKPEYTTMVDKQAVKDYIKPLIGEEYIIPTLGVWNNPEDIDFDSLPNKFVLKTTTGGGSTGVIICEDKSKLDISGVKRTLKTSLKRKIYSTFREWPYKNICPKILAEELLEIPDGNETDLFDYKFFCFNGKPEYCQVISGRKQKMAIDFFDKDWNHQEFHEPKNFPFALKRPEKPQNFLLMLEIAEKLAQNIPFVRIDLYNLNGKIYFGEITFFPTSGLGGFSPDEWDLKFGQLIRLPDIR